ncbi:MAG: hypothetical protein WD830_06575 [Chloroflexota bacterium]
MGKSGFVAIGNANPSNSGLPDLEPPHAAVWLSTTGETWNRLPDEAVFELSMMNDIATRNGQLVAVGSHRLGTEDRPTAWTSLDGREWSRTELSSSLGFMYGVAAGPEGFVAVGSSGRGRLGPTAWLSTDGVTWTAQALDEAAEGVAHEVAVNESGFVAAGGSAQVDSHGFVWFAPVGGSAEEQSVRADIHGIVATESGFVGVGSGCTPFGGTALADCPTSSYVVIGFPTAIVRVSQLSAWRLRPLMREDPARRRRTSRDERPRCGRA